MKGEAALILALCVGLVACNKFKSCGVVPSGEFVSNRANCEYFFLCVDGYFMQLKCSPYTVFDPIAEICSADCKKPEVTTPTTTPKPTPPPIPTAPTIPTTKRFVIPTAPTKGPDAATSCRTLPSGSYVGIPGSCTTFYYCANGRGYLSNCPEQTCFNDSLKTCV